MLLEFCVMGESLVSLLLYLDTCRRSALWGL